jgi:hypothetical protein
VFVGLDRWLVPVRREWPKFWLFSSFKNIEEERGRKKKEQRERLQHKVEETNGRARTKRKEEKVGFGC